MNNIASCASSWIGFSDPTEDDESKLILALKDRLDSWAKRERMRATHTRFTRVGSRTMTNSYCVSCDAAGRMWKRHLRSGLNG